MLRHRNIDRVCAVVLAATMLIACVYTALAVNGTLEGNRRAGYAERLFDTSTAHQIDIVIDDWDGFLETCTSEQYALCSLVIDGEKVGKAAIRGKGNTSLSNVQQYGNDRYSFKIEFDHYQQGKTYYGLDKLCLNNLIQDKTCMKDYLAYTLMNRMGVAAPLCSFVRINVNGEYWGLYLAVEAVEDAFLERNYGDGTGELYKPDSMTMGGGKGNGGGFRMSEFREQFESAREEALAAMAAASDGDLEKAASSDEAGQGNAPSNEVDPEQASEAVEADAPAEGSEALPSSDGFPMPPMMGEGMPDMPQGGPGGGGFGGMGSSDAKLQYTDDDPASYSTIFDNAKTDVSEQDQARLIASLKALNEGQDIESVVDVEAVMRYLVVHSFLVNGDSYTGSMIHNYYLYEDDGVLSMIPWDYNLSFGAFSMSNGGDVDSATAAVNDPIDTPVSGGDVTDRPMVAWIFADEAYTERYHALYREFLSDVYESGWLLQEIDRVSELIAPYVETDPTAFYSYEEFETGVEALRDFCALRLKSIEGQLDGSIPATTDAQDADAEALIDASALDLSDMGEMAMGGRNGSGGGPQNEPGQGGFPGMPDFSNMPDFPGSPGQAPGASAGESEEAGATEFARENLDRDAAGASDGASHQETSAETLAWTALSILILIGGLAFAMRFRTY